MDLFNTLLVSLEMSESDRKLLIVLLVIFVVVLLLLGLIGMLVRYVSHKMGEKIENNIAEAIKFRIIENAKDAMKYGRKKNNRLFFKEATPAIAIYLVLLIFWVVYSSFVGFGINHFANFSDLLFKFDAEWQKDFLGFVTLMSLSVREYPVWVGAHWGSYVIVILFIIASVYLFIAAQAYFARATALRRIVDETYRNSLKGFNFYDESAKAAEREGLNKQ